MPCTICRSFSFSQLNLNSNEWHEWWASLGFEPLTSCLQSECSTNWANWAGCVDGVSWPRWLTWFDILPAKRVCRQQNFTFSLINLCLFFSCHYFSDRCTRINLFRSLGLLSVTKCNSNVKLEFWPTLTFI